LSAGEGAGVVNLSAMEQVQHTAQALREAWLGG
jgi:hypothetical protein